MRLRPCTARPSPESGCDHSIVGAGRNPSDFHNRNARPSGVDERTRVDRAAGVAHDRAGGVVEERAGRLGSHRAGDALPVRGDRRGSCSRGRTSRRRAEHGRRPRRAGPRPSRQRRQGVAGQLPRDEIRGSDHLDVAGTRVGRVGVVRAAGAQDERVGEVVREAGAGREGERARTRLVRAAQRRDGRPAVARAGWRVTARETPSKQLRAIAGIGTDQPPRGVDVLDRGLRLRELALPYASVSPAIHVRRVRGVRDLGAGGRGGRDR